MDTGAITNLQISEVFHLEFLRRLVREVKTNAIALKGGANLRFFFDSPRYSEDMDLDCTMIPTIRLQDTVMGILSMRTFLDTLAVYGIDRIVPPNMRTAKQTETPQRFKVHLIARNGLDLFTKIKFSRRELPQTAIVEEIGSRILRTYRIAPFLAPHYPAAEALAQKISALAGRPAAQARDIFDIYMLRAYLPDEPRAFSPEVIDKARGTIFSIDYERFRDTVVEYLAPEEREVFGTRNGFEEILLRVDEFISSLKARKR